MKDQVAVIGVGCTKFGERFDQSYEELICDAAFEAYADAGIEPAQIDAAYLGTYLPGSGGGKAAVSLGDALRLYDRPITRVENYCATGTDAFRNACLAIGSGAYDVVLVVGAEKLKDRRRPRPAADRTSAPGEGQHRPGPVRAGGEPLHAHLRGRSRDAGEGRGQEPLQRGARTRRRTCRWRSRRSRC